VGAIRVGTSGWHYGHWKGRFYPEELSTEEWLGYYAGRFSTVEINNTFYQLPDVETFVQWREAVPAGFQFAAKASRYLTHMKKLRDPEEPVAHFLEGVRALGDRRGPVLFQLPPNWKVNVERLRSFLAVLPREGRYAFEFRHASWFDERVYEVLRAAGAAFCIHDLATQPSPEVVTADFVYVRLHGTHGPYQGSYDQQVLAGWAGALSTWAGQGKAIYCYFNNDERGYAVQNARTLLDIIG
jgi:uncharacterized protein YecE (DUF72 family)